MQQTVSFSNLRFSARAPTFVSNCGAERGDPFFSLAVTAAGQTKGVDPIFMHPYMANRIADETPNAVSCSSFVATLPSTGLWWINAAARTQKSDPTPSDNEYQMRVYLGEPDLAEGPAGSFTPPPHRLATQTIQYGRVLAPELNPTKSYSFAQDTGFSSSFRLADVGVFPVP
jgi:hypothetical protein